MNCLQLELEISKMARAMMTRNSQIGKDLIRYLKTLFPVDVVAGMMIVCIERVVWFDSESVLWSIQHVIPTDVMQEIHKITTFTLYQQLIRRGLMPGKDFSVDADGKLLLKEQAKTAFVSTLKQAPGQKETN